MLGAGGNNRVSIKCFPGATLALMSFLEQKRSAMMGMIFTFGVALGVTQVVGMRWR